VTTEEMQARIIALEESEKTLKEANTTISASSAEAAKRIIELQEHNQKLFLKITAPEEKTKEEKEEKVQSLEEFALTLKI
jgi:hypothetical protein